MIEHNHFGDYNAKFKREEVNPEVWQPYLNGESFVQKVGDVIPFPGNSKPSGQAETAAETVIFPGVNMQQVLRMLKYWDSKKNP